MNSLRDICDYVVTRTNIIENYISTENMLPNKGGVCDTLKVPSGGIGTKYQVGDILISNIRPYFKKIWQADCEGVCSIDVLCLRANEKVDSRFLYYLLTQQSFFDYVMSGTKGCKMPRGDKQQIMQWHIHLPSLVEQKKIAGVLSTLDAKIQLNRRINDNLEQQAQALYKSWFVDFEPFKNGKFVDSEQGLIPEGWRIGEFSEICDIVGGGTPSKSRTDFYCKNGIAWLTPKDLSVSKAKFTAKGAEDITLEGYNSSSAKLMPRGAVLFSSRAPIGYITIAKNEISTNQGFKSAVPRIAGTGYLYYYLKSNISTIESKASGSTFKEASGALMKSLKVIVPPTQILNDFEKEIDALFRKQELLDDEIINLAIMRDTLLPKLMSGELTINEIDC